MRLSITQTDGSTGNSHLMATSPQDGSLPEKPGSVQVSCPETAASNTQNIHTIPNISLYL
jgi:hypothetical protein